MSWRVRKDKKAKEVPPNPLLAFTRYDYREPASPMPSIETIRTVQPTDDGLRFDLLLCAAGLFLLAVGFFLGLVAR